MSNDNNNNHCTHNHKSKLARRFCESGDKYLYVPIKGDSVTHPYHTCPNCGHTYAE